MRRSWVLAGLVGLLGCGSGGAADAALDTGPFVCVGLSESCTATACCEGLSCCTGSPVAPGEEYCAALGDCPRSDRNSKTDFRSVDPAEVLARVRALPVTEWRYRDEPEQVRHVGPMAQDFRAAFGLGTSDTRIHTVDSNGIALASIQALAAQNEALARDNAALRAELDALRDRVAAIEPR